MSWHADPLVNRDINVKRTSLHLQYMTRIQKWLEKPNNRKWQVEVKNCGQCIEGKNKTLSMNMLNRIESFLKKLFPPVISIDLTSDDDEVILVPPQEKPQPQLIVSSPPLPEPVSSQSSQHLQNVSLDALSEPPINPPTPSRALPESLVTSSIPQLSGILEDLDISLEEAGLSSSTATKKPLARRMSVSAKPSESMANRPFISKYKIKHNRLKPPSVYAKPNEAANKTRNIITVPYKNTPRQSTQVPYNPKEESLKIEGIKQKIYADKFLIFDTKAKEEMQKKLVEEHEADNGRESDESVEKTRRKARRRLPDSDEEISDVIVPEPTRKVPRCSRSTAASSNSVSKAKAIAKTSTKRKLAETARKSTSKATIPTTQAKRKRGRPRKVEARKTRSEEDYEVPSHVFVDVDKDLAELFNEDQSSSNSRDFVQYEDENSLPTDINDNVPCSSPDLGGSLTEENLLIEIPASQAYQPPKKRGPRKKKPKKRRNAVDEIQPKVAIKTETEV